MAFISRYVLDFVTEFATGIIESKESSKVEFDCSADSNDGDLKIKDKISFKIETNADGASIKVEYANKVDSNEDEDEKVKEADKAPVTEQEPSGPSEEKEEEIDESDTEKENNSETTEKVEGEDTPNPERKAKETIGSSESTETKTQYQIVYDSIIEYRKGTNATEGAQEYDFEKDKIIQTIPLTEWDEFSEIVTDAEGVTSYFSASTTDGMVTLNFTVSRASENQHVTANKMKIDFWLFDFPWQKTNSYVALMSTVQSQREIKVESDDKIDPQSAEQGPESARSDNSAGPGSPTAKKPKKVEISFDDAIEATGGVVTFGDYTWESTAKASTSSTKRNNNKGNADATIVPSDSSSDSASENSRQLSQQQQKRTKNEPEDEITVVATSSSVVKEANDKGENDKGSEASRGMTKETIAFSFVGSKAKSASTIYWDPEAGINYSTVSTSGTSLLSWSFIGLISVNFASLIASLIVM
jgi:hypothetical protein